MSTSKTRRPVRPSKYPPQFPADAVALDEGHSIAEVARSLGVIEGTLGNWVVCERKARRRARRVAPPGRRAANGA